MAGRGPSKESIRVKNIRKEILKQTANVKTVINYEGAKRQPMKAYRMMGVKELYKSMISYISNYDKLKQLYIQKQLAYVHLLRRNLLLELKLERIKYRQKKKNG